MLFWLTLSLGTALAMLSKPLDPNSRRYTYWAESRNHSNVNVVSSRTVVGMNELEAMLEQDISSEQVPKLLESFTKVLTSASPGTSISANVLKLSSLVSKFGDSLEIFKLLNTDGDEGYVMAKNRICFGIGLTAETITDIMLDMIIDLKERSFMVKSILCQFLRYIFASLYTCSEKDLPTLYWTLVHYSDIFHTQMTEETDIRIKDFWKDMFQLVPYFVNFIQKILKKAPAFVPDNARFNRFPMIDWASLLQTVTEMPKITRHAVDMLLNSKNYQFKSTNKTIAQIKKDFESYIKRIVDTMDEQFPEQKPEDFVNEAPVMTVSIASEHKTESQIMSSSINSSSKSIAQQRKEKKVEKKEARKLKEQEKHQERIKHIRLMEKDDDDVAFYYTAKNSDANLVFLLNQKEQICRRTFEASARFEHSLFPGLTASGTTMNYLCSLMVSGNPDYEGFVSAHRDLGGIFAEKKNGNKLFLFNEPISYHKTLHAPHQSSRFDHVLYRRFYRNCGLHPYFFITD